MTSLGGVRTPYPIIVRTKDASAIQDDASPPNEGGATAHRTAAWHVGLVGMVAVSASTVPWTVTGLPVPEGQEDNVPLLTLTTLALGGATWMETMLTMNLFTTERSLRVRVVAAVLYLAAAVAWLTSSFAILHRDTWSQFGTSLVGSVVAWAAFVTLFNGNFLPPTRQQVGALPIILVLVLLWEARTVLTNRILVDD